MTDVLCAGIIVADHVSSPIPHPAARRRTGAETNKHAADDRRLCGQRRRRSGETWSANGGDRGASVSDVFGRVVADMLREHNVDVSLVHVTPGFDTSQTLIVNVAGEDRRFIHTFGANGQFRAADILPLERAMSCRILYLGGYLLMENVKANELAAVFAAARMAGAKTVLDVVTPGPSGDYLPRSGTAAPARRRLPAEQSRSGVHYRRIRSRQSGRVLPSARRQDRDHHAGRSRGGAGSRRRAAAVGDVLGPFRRRQRRRRRLCRGLHGRHARWAGHRGLPAPRQRGRGELRSRHWPQRPGSRGRRWRSSCRANSLKIERF